MHHTRRPALRHNPAQGLSMVELLCAVAIMLVLLGGSLPLFNDLRISQRLQATAALLETDVQLARSVAMHTGQPVRLVVRSLQAGGSCWVLHQGPLGACTCDDTGLPRCDAGAQALRSELLGAASGVTLAPLARPLVFDGRRGTVTPTATLRLLAADGRGVHQVVNIMGRVRTCVPAGTTLAGLRPCN